MEQIRVTTGRTVGPRSIELDEPVSMPGELVEVTLRPVVNGPSRTMSGLLEFLRRSPPGTRTKEDIDQQVREERASWGDR